jgi:hypothetical protein
MIALKIYMPANEDDVVQGDLLLNYHVFEFSLEGCCVDDTSDRRILSTKLATLIDLSTRIG